MREAGTFAAQKSHPVHTADVRYTAVKCAELVPLSSVGTKKLRSLFPFGSSFVTAHWAAWDTVFQTGLCRKLPFQPN